jgi:hypothetical protein
MELQEKDDFQPAFALNNLVNFQRHPGIDCWEVKSEVFEARNSEMASNISRWGDAEIRKRASTLVSL